MLTSLGLVLYYLDWSYLQPIVLGINFLIPSQGAPDCHTLIYLPKSTKIGFEVYAIPVMEMSNTSRKREYQK
jgi:hypothetical protein